MTMPREAHTATLLPGGKVFVAPGDDGDDWQSADVYDPSTAKYTSVAAFNDNMSTPNWTRFVATLPLSLAGKTVQVGFEAMTDGTKNTNFFVDTVALDVVACTPAP